MSFSNISNSPSYRPTQTGKSDTKNKANTKQSAEKKDAYIESNQNSTPINSPNFDINVTEVKPNKSGLKPSDGCQYKCQVCQGGKCVQGCRSCACNGGSELLEASQPGEPGFIRIDWNEIDNA